MDSFIFLCVIVSAFKRPSAPLSPFVGHGAPQAPGGGRGWSSKSNHEEMGNIHAAVRRYREGRNLQYFSCSPTQIPISLIIIVKYVDPTQLDSYSPSPTQLNESSRQNLEPPDGRPTFSRSSVPQFPFSPSHFHFPFPSPMGHHSSLLVSQQRVGPFEVSSFPSPNQGQANVKFFSDGPRREGKGLGIGGLPARLCLGLLSGLSATRIRGYVS